MVNIVGQATDIMLTVVLIVLGIMTFFCLLRACLGPAVSDRLIAVNMLNTMVIVMIAILAVKLDEMYLVDICIIYAMISFVSVIVLSKVIIGVYREKTDKGAKEQITVDYIVKDREDN